MDGNHKTNHHFAFSWEGVNLPKAQLSPLGEAYWAMMNTCTLGMADIARQESEHTLVETREVAHKCLQECINSLYKAQSHSTGEMLSIDESLETIFRSTQKQLLDLWGDHCCRMWTLPMRLGQSAEGQKRFPVTLEGQSQSLAE